MDSSEDYIVRPATPEDTPAVNVIHRHYVENTVITFVTEPNSDEDTLANYNKVNGEGLPYLVAVNESDKSLLGYCFVSPFRGVRPGYRYSVELSLFCHPDQLRKGMGKALLTRLIHILENPEKWNGWYEGTRLLDYKVRQVLAVMAIDVDMPGNGLKLRDWYLQFGFVERGHLKDIGWKKERWIDTLYLQLTLR